MKYAEVRILLRLDDETKMDSMDAFNTAVGAFEGVVTAEVNAADAFLVAAVEHERWLMVEEADEDRQQEETLAGFLNPEKAD